MPRFGNSRVKGPTRQHHDGRSLRIGIVHARWNEKIVAPLLEGTMAKLLECGVHESNIVVQSVPGVWELPIAVQCLNSASRVQSSTSSFSEHCSSRIATSNSPFDALVAIGALIKGETMHFEYIAESASHALQRVALDTGVPVVFGVLTVMNIAQAEARAGLIPGSPNHGEDWGLAAVEMSVKRRAWAAGIIE